MAEFQGSDTRLYMDGVDISTPFREAECGRERPRLDTTGFGAAADSHKLGNLVKAMATAGGIFQTDQDTTPHAIEEMLQAAAANITSDSVFVHMFRDTTLGDPGMVIVGGAADHKFKAILKDVCETGFGIQSNRSGLTRALRIKSASTGATNGSRVDHGAATTNGGLSVLQVFALTGSDATNEVQTLTLTLNSGTGTFTLTYAGQTTGAIAHNANAATVQAALIALSNIGASDVVCAGTLAAGMTVTFQGALAATDVAALTADLTGITGDTPDAAMSIVETTKGVAPIVVRVKTQHDNNDNSWVDLATHTDVTEALAANGHAEAITVPAGTVNRGLRSNLSIVSGTLTSITFALSFVRNPTLA